MTVRVLTLSATFHLKHGELIATITPELNEAGVLPPSYATAVEINKTRINLLACQEIRSDVRSLIIRAGLILEHATTSAPIMVISDDYINRKGRIIRIHTENIIILIIIQSTG